MPHAYEMMRDKFMEEGLSEQKAKAKAAAIYNAHHKTGKVSRWEKKKHRQGKSERTEQ